MDEEPVEIPTLDALIEIREPEPVSNAPDTPAWTVLFAVVGVLLLVAIALLWRRWRRSAYRRAGLAALGTIAERGRARELPVLVKRVALDAWPRDEVAELSGEPWLRFLDASYGGTGFATGPGRCLLDLAYGGTSAPDTLDDGLVALVRTWIKTHHVRDAD